MALRKAGQVVMVLPVGIGRKVYSLQYHLETWMSSRSTEPGGGEAHGPRGRLSAETLEEKHPDRAQRSTAEIQGCSWCISAPATLHPCKKLRHWRAPGVKSGGPKSRTLGGGKWGPFVLPGPYELGGQGGAIFKVFLDAFIQERRR